MMTPPSDERVSDIFLKVIDLPEEEREIFLEGACGQEFEKSLVSCRPSVVRGF